MTAPGAREVPFEPGMIERLAAGVRFMFTGDSSLYDGWFGPGTPPVPVADPSTEGRQFDYDTNVNTRFQPRQGYPISFQTLRNMADGYDLMRLVIESKKDVLVQTEWNVRPIDKNQKPDDRCKKIQDFLRFPDREHTWEQWFRACCEDLLVADAWTIWPRKTKGGSLYSLDLIDGTTIKPVVALDGRRPETGPVYQQVLKGVIVADFMPGELYYMPQNVRTHRIYGYSRVEQVITTVNIAINRQLHKLSYYTDGSAVDSVIEAPDGWNVDQVKKFRDWWIDLLSGNLKERRKGMVVPHGSKLTNLKEAALKDEYDDLLARYICYAFSVSPSQLIKEQNRGKDETQKDQAKEEGTRPVLDFFSKQLSRMICRDLFKADDLEIAPMEEKALQPLVQAQIDDLDVQNGIRDINECREGRGLQPLTPEQLEERKPTPPPSPFGPGGPGGAAPLPGEEPPSAKPPTAAAPAPTVKPGAAKLAKASKIQPINRDRATVTKLEAKLKKVTLAFLKAQVVPIAQALHAAMPKTADKMAKMSSEEAKQLLEASNIDWHELGDDLEPILAAIAQDGVAQGLAQVSAKTTADLLDQVNEKAVIWAEQHSADLVTKLADTTRKSLRGDLASAIELGMSADDIAGVIGEDYGFSEARAELIARTERAFADIRGNTLAYAASGVVGGLQWITANEGDDKVCPDCEMNDGEEVDMDENGEAVEPFPSGDTVAPGHPDCRCDLLPVLKPETEE